MNILITGGAGFIGSHLTKRLLLEEHRVTVLDNFNPQIHGSADYLPDEVSKQVKLIKGDVRDREVVCNALKENDAVVHLAAETGTGQSMYEIMRYEDVNIKGTAVLLDVLMNGCYPVKKIIVASSRAIYGEGAYRCNEHGIIYPSKRRIEDLREGRFEPVCTVCKRPCQTQPTEEHATIHPTSFYGITKQVQEQMVLMFAETLGISAFALRYQNVYGPGQSLNNPYTGILAIFSNQARAGQPIYIFEDGKESRDFVFIDDVVEATCRCIQHESTEIAAINVGSGKQTTVHEVASQIVDYYGGRSNLIINGAYRDGDIRHNVADLAKAKNVIGYAPEVPFDIGLKTFLGWADSQELVLGRYESSLQEMRSKGLIHEM